MGVGVEFAFSLFFAFAAGYAAAKNRRARALPRLAQRVQVH
jgi:hypothetical protein